MPEHDTVGAVERHTGLFQPEIVLPVQQLVQRSSDDVPEKRLMLAILDDAVRSFQGLRLARRNRHRRLFNDAKDWLSSTDTGWPFSFERICQVLELDASYLRRGLSQWHARQLAHLISANAATLSAPQLESRIRAVGGAAQTAPRNLWALVLAGGDGTRLQDLTRAITGRPIPKQYCRILGGRSLLEATLSRCRCFAPPHRTIVIVNRDHLKVSGDQLRGLPAANVIVQPRNRDTGPGVLLSLFFLARRQPSAIVALFPSDHYVRNERAFAQAVVRASHIVAQFPEKLAVLGFPPQYPEPGYGYILPGRALRTRSRIRDAFDVARFIEKPGAELARRLLASGALWNSFVIVFRLRRLLDLLQATVPDKFAQMAMLRGHPEGAAAIYRDLAPWNFSSQVLGRIAEHLIVLRVEEAHWSDWGTLESIEQTLSLLDRKPPRSAAGTSRSRPTQMRATAPRH
jgi:mannose-1-phosphate guanylyltransferase